MTAPSSFAGLASLRAGLTFRHGVAGAVPGDPFAALPRPGMVASGVLTRVLCDADDHGQRGDREGLSEIYRVFTLADGTTELRLVTA